jgi:hypothetical protein
VLVGAGLLVVTVIAGGLQWKARQDRDAACDRAYAELQEASRTTAFDGMPYEGVEAERRIRSCLEQGWTASG